MRPVAQVLQELAAATDTLLAGIGGLTDADARAPPRQASPRRPP